MKGRRISLFSSLSDSFPGGLLDLVLDAARRDKVEVQLIDKRTHDVAPDPAADLAWLRDYQREAVEAVVVNRRGIIQAATGAGKCLGYGTPVMLADRRVVPVQDIRVGDDVMGPDGLPRRVHALGRGRAPLYKVTPTTGASWVCNDEHILTITRDSVVGKAARVLIDISVKDLLRNDVLHGAYQLLRVDLDHQIPYVRVGEVCDFTLEPIGEGDYFGFTLDGDGRFLLGDFTVTHNTEIIVGVTRRLPGTWLMLVHRDVLVEQASDRYALRGGQAAANWTRVPVNQWAWAPGLNVMTFQTLTAAIRRDQDAVDKAFARLSGVMVDECHVVPSTTYFAALMRCPAEYRIGFSGTPLDRTDNRSLMAVAGLGKVIYKIRAKQLIDAGVLAAPKITIVPVRQQPLYGDKYLAIYKQRISQSETRNAAIVQIAKSAPKPCMVFVKEIEHGRLIKAACEKGGLATEFVYGLTDGPQRRAAIERLERGDADVLIASVVFQEGVDIPGLESVVIASGGQSVIAALQRVGRGMRTNNGAKQTFQVYDILDLGVPCLEKHARRRMNTYVRESYETVVAESDGTLRKYAPVLKTRRENRGR